MLLITAANQSACFNFMQRKHSVWAAAHRIRQLHWPLRYQIAHEFILPPWAQGVRLVSPDPFLVRGLGQGTRPNLKRGENGCCVCGGTALPGTFHHLLQLLSCAAPCIITEFKCSRSNVSLPLTRFVFSLAFFWGFLGLAWVYSVVYIGHTV